MKKILLAVVLSCVSGATLAAMPMMSSGDGVGMVKIGEVSAQANTLDDFQQVIVADAQKMGASSYHITSATVNNHVYGTAVLYK
ncbi:multiple stress resistance protein BhsA [Serratia sp. S1B]|nr:multiple stress resistance protein BhsA [Serratia sp. S1B]